MFYNRGHMVMWFWRRGFGKGQSKAGGKGDDCYCCSGMSMFNFPILVCPNLQHMDTNSVVFIGKSYGHC